MCQMQNIKVTVSHYFFHIALVSFIVNWVIHFYHFPHVTNTRLIICITAGCLETISNVAYNISDPPNDKYPRKEGSATKI